MTSAHSGLLGTSCHRPGAECRPTRAVSMLALGLMGTLVVCGCGAPARPTLTDAQLQERVAMHSEEQAATFHRTVTKLLARVDGRAEASSDGTTTVHFLAMSGGGDKGAFGAGFLVGWGESSDSQWRRPEFDAVTGVSTGALLAPFAYLGTDEACLEVETFYRNPKSDWVRKRGALFFLPSNPSFATLPGLDRDIRATMNATFIERLAEQSRSGKVLIVSATDLDLGRQTFWDVGAEAETATSEADVDRIDRMLLASAAIPGAFPPVQIGDEIYVDGAVTANVFLRLEGRDPNSFIARWRTEHPNEPFPKVRYWIIINNQLSHRPETVQLKWPSVVGPSLSISIRSATLAEVRWLAAQADYINAVHGTDIEVRVVAIPDDWRPPVDGDFEQATMVSLTDLGRRMGADPASWKLWASPQRPTSGGSQAAEPLREQ